MRPMTVDVAVHDELENWARVVRDPRFIARTCTSAEGRYRPERVKGEPEREAASRDTPRLHEGLLAERVICSPLFPRLARDLLVSHYVQLGSRSQVCRRCAVPLAQFEVRMGWAAKIFANRLDMVIRAGVTMRGNNSIPPHGAYAA